MIKVINASGRRFFRGFMRDLREFLRTVMEREGMRKNVDVILVNDSYMRRLNREFLFKDKTTDVISFDYGDMGEIYVNVDYASRLGDFAFYTGYLALHGLLHVLGYDHKRKDREEEMEKKQKACIKLWKYY